MKKEFIDYELDGINIKDCPDFSDSYIVSANVIENGNIREATKKELDRLNENRDLVYNLVLKNVF